VPWRPRGTEHPGLCLYAMETFYHAAAALLVAGLFAGGLVFLLA
jgi:hypothetical protein